MRESPLFWPVQFDNGCLVVVDETKIPQIVHIAVNDYHDSVRVIRQMRTRAFGQFLIVLLTFFLEVSKMKNEKPEKIVKQLAAVKKALDESRPTFPFAEVTALVMGWAQQLAEQKANIVEGLEKRIFGFLESVRQQRYQRAEKAAQFVKDGDTVLTHCNVSGEMPLIGEFAHQMNRTIKFIATETRPYFQGSRLTAWELEEAGFDVTVIPDNAVADVMSKGMVNLVIVGSDRATANGDFANKIGTYQIALLAKEFKIPFYVLYQPSDKVKSGKDIPVEIRDEDEVLIFEGKCCAPKGAAAFYPGFDVVDHSLVTAHISIEASRQR